MEINVNHLSKSFTPNTSFPEPGSEEESIAFKKIQDHFFTKQ